MQRCRDRIHDGLREAIDVGDRPEPSWVCVALNTRQRWPYAITALCAKYALPVTLLRVFFRVSIPASACMGDTV